MRKLLLLFPLLTIMSCEKIEILPEEYDLIIGEWELEDYSVTSVSYGVTLPADSLGYTLSITIAQNSIICYMENTTVREVKNYYSIDFNSGIYGGETVYVYYFKYRNAIGEKSAFLVSYLPAKDLLVIDYTFYDSDNGVYVGPDYSFNFRRI